MGLAEVMADDAQVEFGVVDVDESADEIAGLDVLERELGVGGVGLEVLAGLDGLVELDANLVDHASEVGATDHKRGDGDVAPLGMGKGDLDLGAEVDIALWRRLMPPQLRFRQATWIGVGLEPPFWKMWTRSEDWRKGQRTKSRFLLDSLERPASSASRRASRSLPWMPMVLTRPEAPGLGLVEGIFLAVDIATPVLRPADRRNR